MNAAMYDSDQWRPCPSGELRRMVARERTQQRRLVLKKLGGTAAGLLVLGDRYDGVPGVRVVPKEDERRYDHALGRAAGRPLDPPQAVDPMSTCRLLLGFHFPPLCYWRSSRCD